MTTPVLRHSSRRRRARRKRAQWRRVAIIAGAVLVVALVTGGAWLAVKPEAAVNATQMNAAAADAAKAAQSARAITEASLAADAKRATAAFIGDSYNGGTGGIPVGGTWVSMLADGQGWTVENFGVGGTGYANRDADTGKLAYYERLAEILKHGDGVILVSGGRNDVAQWNHDPVATAQHISDTFAALRAGAPTAKIIALNPWWDDDPAPQGLGAISDTVKAAVIAVGGQYIDTGQPLAGHPEFVIEDGIHPNEAGHAALAAAAAAAITAAGT